MDIPSREKSVAGVPADALFLCRPGCGACCIAPSISSLGKPAGLPCPHLDEGLRCRLWGTPDRPAVCASLTPCPEMCGADRAEALAYLAALEAATAP